MVTFTVYLPYSILFHPVIAEYLDRNTVFRFQRLRHVLDLEMEPNLPIPQVSIPPGD